MARHILITCGEVRVTGTLNDSASADALWNALPIKGIARTWGDEIYFPIPLALAEEVPQEVVDLGAVGYWPPGKALCLFFGPTPASRGDEIRPASAVNVLGRIQGDARALKQVPSGSPVRVERA